MSAWLEPLRLALQRECVPRIFFFRDDDGGWGNERLYPLLDLFADFEVPIDLALIPIAVTHGLARELQRRIEQSPRRLGLHQHGLSHQNHQPQGRKSEFGAARSKIRQSTDITLGDRRLRALLGDWIDPIFTPPWNRCTQVTVDLLAESGFRVLSRDITAGRVRLGSLIEVPISIDWCKQRRGGRINKLDLGELLAARVCTQSSPIGVMLHHVEIGAAERRTLAELLDVFAGSSRISCRCMRDIAAPAHPSPGLEHLDGGSTSSETEPMPG